MTFYVAFITKVGYVFDWANIALTFLNLKWEFVREMFKNFH